MNKITITELMKVLRPSKYLPFMKVCSNFLKEINEAKIYGEDHYEISGVATKSGNPIRIDFGVKKNDW